MSKPFHFKQFQILQDQCAMKVGTDGVLLGSWVSTNKRKPTILDIGTGSGLIALMLAQKYPNANLEGIEIEPLASKQAQENILHSKFKNQISIINTSVQNYESEKKYDLIVSNPPFFEPNRNILDSSRTKARQTIGLTFTELIGKALLLLKEDGCLNLIFPFNREEEILIISSSIGFYPKRITRVKGVVNGPIKRSLIEFKKKVTTPIFIDELTIEVSRHKYTEKYIELVKDFYLKM